MAAGFVQREQQLLHAILVATTRAIGIRHRHLSRRAGEGPASAHIEIVVVAERRSHSLIE